MSPLSVAAMLPSAFKEAQEEAAKLRRRDDIMGAVGICLALRAAGDAQLAKLGEASPDLLFTAIQTALDEGKTLDEATAAVVAAIEGGN